MSRRSIQHKNSRQQSNFSEDEQLLSKEWDVFGLRLNEIEKQIVILQKRQNKIDKKFNIHAEETTRINIEHAEELNLLKQHEELIERGLHESIEQMLISIKKQIGDDIDYKIEKSINELNIDSFQISEIIEKKTHNLFEQTKSYVDRAVFELKQLLRKYVKEQTDLQRKIVSRSKQKIVDSPRISLGGSRSIKKFNFESQSIKEVDSVESKSFINNKEQSASTSRVSYLKEKLKQFQKINKKYDISQQSEKMERKKEDVMVEKMKNYREYLEQSESELDQSNLNCVREPQKDKIFLKNTQKNRLFAK